LIKKRKEKGKQQPSKIGTAQKGNLMASKAEKSHTQGIRMRESFELGVRVEIPKKLSRKIVWGCVGLYK